MEKYAANGNKVLMVNLVGTRAPQATKYDILKIFRKVKEWFSGYKIINGIYVICPFRFPFIKYEIFNQLNQLILYIYLKYYFRKFNISKPIFWVLNVLYPDLLKRIDKKTVIYYVSDDYGLFTGNIREVFEKYEKKMLEISDGVITVHRNLYRKLSIYNTNTINILNSTNPEHFINSDKTIIPQDLKSIKHPIAGFSGKIEDWVDLELIKGCALRYPKYSFVLIGPEKVDTRPMHSIENIYFLGKKDYKELPFYLNNFDICLLPFKKNKLTESMSPLKLVEYFAVGKPTVAININNVDIYSDAYTLVQTEEEFIKEVGCAMQKDNNNLQERRKQIALENSWEKRAEELSDWIKDTIFS